MIKLDSTSKSLEVLLTAAATTTELPVYASYSDISQSTFGLTGAGSNDTITTGATAVTAVSAPAASTTRKIDLVTVYNEDTVAAEVTVRVNSASNRILIKETIRPGETLQYCDGEGWSVANKKKGYKSDVNSSTSALSSGATFTGSGEFTDEPDVMLVCETDNTGTLYTDFSQDGTNWTTFPTAGFKLASGINEFHTAVKGPRYQRTRLVNDTGAQSYLRLSTYYGDFKQGNAPLNQPYGLDSDSRLVRPSLPWLDISRGLVTGLEAIQKFGRNDSVSTSFVPVAMGSVYQTPQSGSATALRIAAGGNANDTAAGTGARSVTFEGLDENFALASEAVATAGASASSATTTTFTRLFRAYLTPSTGSGTYATAAAGSHSGTITIENSAGGTTWGIIDATGFPKGQSEIAAYSVPTGYRAYIKPKAIYVDTNRTTDIILFWRANADETSAPYSAMRAQAVVIGATRNVLFGDGEVPFGPYVGPCDVGFMAKADASADVAIEFEIYLVNE